MFALGSLLAQHLFTGVNAFTAFTASLNTEITRIVVVNTGNSNITMRLFHNDTGTTYSNAYALYWDITIQGSETLVIEAPAAGSGIHVQRGGSIGIQFSDPNVANTSIYGVTETLAERPRA